MPLMIFRPGPRRALGACLALCLSLSLAVAGLPRSGLAQARSEGATEARTHVQQGEALFERENFDAALAEFERAYQLLEGHPQRYFVLFNIGQCHERLFRYDRALAYYQRYLDEGGPQAEDRATVEATMRALEGLLATLEIRVNVPRAQVWIDDREVGTAPGTIRVPGGRHTVELRAPGYLPSRQEIQVASRATERVSVTLERAGGVGGVSPGFFLGSAGIAVVAAGLGIGFGVAALGARSDALDRLDDPVLRYQVGQGDRDDIDRLALTADIFFGVAALFGVGATVLLFLTDWGGHEDAPAEPAGATARVRVLAGPASGGLELSVGF